VKQLSLEDDHKRTALHAAAATGSYAVIQRVTLRLDVHAGHLMALDVDGDTPCQVALRCGHVPSATLLIGAPGSWIGLASLPAKQKAVTDCVQGALVQLRPTAPSSDRVRRAPSLLLHNDSAQVLSHLDERVQELGRQTDVRLSREALEALLRFHGFVVDDGVAAYRQDPRSALDAVGLRDVSVPQPLSNHTMTTSPQPQLIGDSRPQLIAADLASAEQAQTTPQGDRIDVADVNIRYADTARRCMVCFDDIIGESACTSLSCGHSTCDACLSLHVDVRLQEGDVNGVRCPEPSCRLPILVDIVRSLFGPESLQAARLEALQAQKFVDTHKGSAWCPRPGCGKAVSLLEGRQQVSVKCACGTRFCFTCKALGGHGIASCEDWQAFHSDLEAHQKKREDASEKWLQTNARDCKCGAKIQRAGGCNHMICSVCGYHFCYACGQDWNSHRNQPGGFDHYACRMQQANPAAIGNLTAQRFEACYRGWLASSRDSTVQDAILGILQYLTTEFQLSETMFVHATSVVADARECLQQSYCLRYCWCSEKWENFLAQCVGDLERTTNALEIAIGVRSLSSELEKLDATLMKWEPEDLVYRLDLRQVVAHLIAASTQAAMIEQVAASVVLQTARVSDAARAGYDNRAAPLARLQSSLGRALAVRNGPAASTSATSQCAVM